MVTLQTGAEMPPAVVTKKIDGGIGGLNDIDRVCKFSGVFRSGSYVSRVRRNIYQIGQSLEDNKSNEEPKEAR